jgi:hypothetical protein
MAGESIRADGGAGSGPATDQTRSEFPSETPGVNRAVYAENDLVLAGVREIQSGDMR